MAKQKRPAAVDTLWGAIEAWCRRHGVWGTASADLTITTACSNWPKMNKALAGWNLATIRRAIEIELAARSRWYIKNRLHTRSLKLVGLLLLEESMGSPSAERRAG